MADPRYEKKPRTTYVTDPVLTFSIGKARDMCQPSTDEPHWELRKGGEDRLVDVGQ